MSNLRRVLKAIEPHPGEHFKDKAIAVGLALLVWVAVNAEDQILDILDPVPVEVVNLPQQYAIADDWQQSISVRVRGSVRDLSRVSPGSMTPTLDLSEAGPGENVFRITPDDLDAPPGVQVESINPSQISIVLEDRLQKEVPISAVTSGEPAEGYEVAGKTTVPETTRVSGPRSQIEALERVETAVVDVHGLSESFTQMVPLLTSSPFLELGDTRNVQMQVDILERAVTRDFDAVPVEVVDARYQVAVNPETLRVVLSGPPSFLDRIDRETLRLVIDASNLEPRAEDYLLTPTIDFGQEDLVDFIEVVALSQRRINVHVFNQPSRQ